MNEYEGKVYKKGWGKEGVIWQSPEIAIWALNINKSHRTSLHMHPSKKTCLVNLGGVVRVSFLNDDRLLAPGDGMNIHKGVFHRTEAITHSCFILESECPNQKNDILRLRDDYGREGKGIEGEEAVIQGESPMLLVRGETNIIGECGLEFINLDKYSCLEDIPDGKILVLSGGLHRKNVKAIGCGDLTDSRTLVRLSENFEMLDSMEILHISKL